MIDITIILKALGYIVIGVGAVNVIGYIAVNETEVDPGDIRLIVVLASFVAGVTGTLLAIK